MAIHVCYIGVAHGKGVWRTSCKKMGTPFNSYSHKRNKEQEVTRSRRLREPHESNYDIKQRPPPFPTVTSGDSSKSLFSFGENSTSNYDL